MRKRDEQGAIKGRWTVAACIHVLLLPALLSIGHARIDPCGYDLAGSRLAGPSTLLRPHATVLPDVVFAEWFRSASSKADLYSDCQPLDFEFLLLFYVIMNHL